MKPLQVQASNPESDRIPFSVNGGHALAVGVSTQIPFHEVPAGFRDEVWCWWNNTDDTTDGHILVRFGPSAGNDIICNGPHRQVQPVLQGFPINGPVTLEALAITQPGKLLGFVRRVRL